jgi:hypothetical protein
MRVDPDSGIGEFGHIGAADHDEAGAAQARHDRCVGLRRGRILQRARAGTAHLSPDVKEILDRDGNACIRRRRRVGLAQPVHPFGCLNGGLLVDVNERSGAFA